MISANAMKVVADYITAHPMTESKSAQWEIMVPVDQIEAAGGPNLIVEYHYSQYDKTVTEATEVDPKHVVSFCKLTIESCTLTTDDGEIIESASIRQLQELSWEDVL